MLRLCYFDADKTNKKIILLLSMQNFLEKTNATDASGNIVFGDIGVHIQQEVWDCNLSWLLNQRVCLTVILF